jgi:hypothetical protein
MSLWYFLFSGKLILGQSALAVVLIIEMLGSMPTAYAQATPGPTNSTTITRSMQSNEAGPIRPRYAYIDVAAATRIAGLPSNLTQVAGLSNSRIAYLMFSTNQVKVISTSGAQVYLTDLTSALGTRATNRQTLKIYPIANGELIVTVEGSNIGCDNNTGNLFAFLRLSATGTVTTALTNISAATRAYNCYTSMAELSNGNLAFTYQITGDSYALRIFQPNGTAVTSETSIQKTGTGQGTCSSQSVYSAVIGANKNGTFLISHHCNGNTNLYGVLYNNNGTQITVGSNQHFVIGTYVNSPNQAVMAMTDNNYMVAYTSNNGTSYPFKQVQPNGTVSSAGTYSNPDPSFSVPFFALGDGGFVALNYRMVTSSGKDYYYTTGATYSNSGSAVQAATDLDNTYDDKCDAGTYNNCDSSISGYLWNKSTTGYVKGIMYVNGRTKDLVLHSFGTSTHVSLSSFSARPGRFDLGAWLKSIWKRN